MGWAVVFPGQGSQSVGMMAELAAAHPVVQATFAEASAALGYDLWARLGDRVRHAASSHRVIPHRSRPVAAIRTKQSRS